MEATTKRFLTEKEVNIMDILFYPTFTNIGERLILVHNAEIKFSELPENARRGFEEIEPQSDTIDVSDLSCRWWLCAECVRNLQELGFDRFKLVRS